MSSFEILSFGDELEKIAENRLQKAIRLGQVGAEEITRLGKKRVGRQHKDMQSLSPERYEKLLKIREKRFLDKGLSPQEAKRMAGEGKSGGNFFGRAEDALGDGLRGRLKREAARKAGRDPNKAVGLADAERDVMQGVASPESLLGKKRGAKLTKEEDFALKRSLSNLGVTSQKGAPNEMSQVLKGRKVGKEMEAKARSAMKGDKSMQGAKGEEAIGALRSDIKDMGVDKLTPLQRALSESPDPKVRATLGENFKEYQLNPKGRYESTLARKLYGGDTSPNKAMKRAKESLQDQKDAKDMERLWSTPAQQKSPAATTPPVQPAPSPQAPPPPAAAAPPPPAAQSPASDLQARAEQLKARAAAQQQQVQNMQQQVAKQQPPVTQPTTTPAAPTAQPTPTPSPAPSYGGGAPASTPAAPQQGMSMPARVGLGIGAAGAAGLGGYGIYRHLQNKNQGRPVPPQ